MSTRSRAIVLLSAALATGCGAPDGTADGGADAAAPDAAPTIVDCTDSPSCPPLAILDDPPATLPDGSPSPARGYVDAALELDPLSGEILLSYTFVSTQALLPGATRPDFGASVHVARSGDGGRTYRFAAGVWESQPENDPVTGSPGYSGHEVSSLLPGAGAWWGTHVRIHDPAGGGNNRRTDAFHLVLARAARPEDLGAGASLRLAGTAASDAWEIDHRLSALSPELERCTLWLDPEVVSREDRLYLLALCVVYEGGERVPAESFYGVFELPVEGAVAGMPRWIGRI